MRIVLAGPESSGKSSLAVFLSGFYKGRLILEYSRSFLNSTQRKIGPEDIMHMAINQHDISLHHYLGEGIQFEDCDLLNYIIWLDLKFKMNNTEIEKLWLKSSPDLYLLCFHDILWEYDPLREDPKGRGTIFRKYQEYLENAGFNYQIITGAGIQRINRAKFFINQIMK